MHVWPEKAKQFASHICQRRHRCKMIKMNQDEEVRHTSKHQVQQNQIASQNHGWLGWSPGDPGALVFADEFTPHLRIAIQLQKVEFLRRQNKSREAGLQEPSRNTRNCLEIDHLTPAAPSRKALARVKQIYVAS